MQKEIKIKTKKEIMEAKNVSVEDLERARDMFIQIASVIVERSTWSFDEFEKAQTMFNFIKANIEALTATINTFEKEKKEADENKEG